MSTSFPSFTPPTTNSLWFSSGEPYDDEIELCILEEKYQNWMKEVTEKDKDTPYIGKKADAAIPPEPDGEGESDESEEDLNGFQSEEELNGFQDSPEDQNPGLQVDMDLDATDDTDNNSWMM